MFEREFRKIGPRACLFASLALLILFVYGCGGKSKEGEVAEDEPAAETESETGTSGKSTTGKGTSSKKSSKPKQVMIGDIPKDVWFDDPLGVAANTAQIGGGTPKAAVPAPEVAATKTTTPAASNPPAEAPAAAGGGKDDWKSIISGEIIGEETKKIKARMTDGLSNVGRYNANYKDIIQVDGAVLAALAGIETAHPDPISWKGDAKFVRDLSSDIAAKAKGLGPPSYDPTKQTWEKLEGVLSGNKPGDLGESAPTVPFSEVARRQLLMKRMERAFNAMKLNINNEDTFKKSGEVATHESTLLAALAKVVGTEGYEAADEDDYQKFINEVIAGNQAVATAVKDGNFKAFNDGLTRCYKACNDCHASYKNN